jgi:hypothetical protein
MDADAHCMTAAAPICSGFISCLGIMIVMVSISMWRLLFLNLKHISVYFMCHTCLSMLISSVIQDGLLGCLIESIL